LVQAAGGEEGAAVDDETAIALPLILSKINEAAARRHGDQAAQLRMTADDVSRYAEIGEWCARVKFHY
jgi:hypothetical protein